MSLKNSKLCRKLNGGLERQARVRLFHLPVKGSKNCVCRSVIEVRLDRPALLVLQLDVRWLNEIKVLIECLLLWSDCREEVFLSW